MCHHRLVPRGYLKVRVASMCGPSYAKLLSDVASTMDEASQTGTQMVCKDILFTLMVYLNTKHGNP